MLRSGIPPSLDRQNRRISIAAGGIIVLVVFFALMYVGLRTRDRVSESVFSPLQGGEARLKAYAEEKERASAYAAVRNHLDQKKDEPGITAVYCRDCRHRWVNGRIEFQGDVDFLDDGGRLKPHTYIAVLSGSSQRGWNVESLKVKATRPKPAQR